MQWYGGLGFVVLSLALLIGPGVAARRLANISGEGEDLIGSTRGHARRVLAVYLAFTVAGIALLWALGLEPFAAVVHTLAAVSTGGYSSFDGSLAGLGLSTQWAVTLLSLAGAVALSTWYRAARGGPAALADDLQLRALLLATLAVTVLLALFMLRSGQPWGEVVRHAPLLALSAQTTTGFASLDVGTLDPAARITLAGSMLVGGGVGSTAGGFKILRLLILLRLLQILLHRTRLVEHAVVEYRLGETRIEPEEGLRALLVVVLYIGVVTLSWLPFAAAGYDPLNALFEVVSATATVGLSTGITALELDPWLKGILCLDMLLGRLEVLALLVVLYPRTWFGRRND
jgi:trk system potassium uptake protein TrkH